MRQAAQWGWRAVDAAPTRGYLRLRRTVGTVGIALGILLMVGSVALVIADHRARDAPGDTHANGTVTAVTSTVGGSTGPTSSVDYTFVVRDNGNAAVHTGHISLARPSAAYTVGAQIEITYPADRPDEAHVVGEVHDAWMLPWFVPLLLGVAALIVAIGALSRLRWITNVLTDNPWVLVEAALIERPMRMLQLHGAPSDGDVLAEALSWRSRDMHAMVPQAWVAGSGRRFLVAAPGGAPVLCVRRVRMIDDSLRAFDISPLPSRLAGDES